MIRIVSKKEGFRRCGIAHRAKPTEYPNDRFSKKELAKLKADPMLIVDEIPDKENPREEKNPEGGKADAMSNADEKTGKEKIRDKKDK
ncbi:MAG: HI1506-related protein [Pseudomonadota bacterium]